MNIKYSWIRDIFCETREHFYKTPWTSIWENHEKKLTSNLFERLFVLTPWTFIQIHEQKLYLNNFKTGYTLWNLGTFLWNSMNIYLNLWMGILQKKIFEQFQIRIHFVKPVNIFWETPWTIIRIHEKNNISKISK